MIVRKGKTAEKESRSPVVLAPDQLIAENLRENTRLMTLNEIIRNNPTTEADKLTRIRPRHLRKS